MADNVRTQWISLACGALILIALIVLIFSSRGSAVVESELHGLRSEVSELNKSVEGQSIEIKSLAEKLDKRQGASPRAGVQADLGFKPVPLPDPKIPGFVFPEKEATIVEWTEKDNQQAINRHGWGIWTALTSPSGEKFDGRDLLVFDTWSTPGDL